MKQIFFSYSEHPDDKGIYSKLGRHFHILEKNQFLKIVDSDDVFSQNNEKGAAFKIADKCDLIVPILSADYLNDSDQLDFLSQLVNTEKEMILVLGRDCMYEDIPGIKHRLPSLMPEGGSVFGKKDEKHDEDEILKQIAVKIKNSAMGTLNFEIKTNIKMLIFGILSFLSGIIAASYVYRVTSNMLLMALTMTLFMTLTMIALLKYFTSKQI